MTRGGWQDLIRAVRRSAAIAIASVARAAHDQRL
jgi:hypothetical protein